MTLVVDLEEALLASPKYKLEAGEDQFAREGHRRKPRCGRPEGGRYVAVGHFVGLR